MDVLDILDRPIAFQRPFVTITGSITAALMLSQAVYWSKRTTLGGGWFYKTQKEMEEETGLSRYEQETARKILVKKGFLSEKKVGVPCKLHYRVNAETLQSSLLETPKLDCGKPANKIAVNQQTITETTTEITAEITANTLPDLSSKDAAGGKASPSKVKKKKKEEKEIDPRHAPCIVSLEKYWNYLNEDSGIKLPFDGRTARVLSDYLKRNSSLTHEQFHGCLLNRAKSEEINPTEDPIHFISKLTSYIGGPLNKFGKAKGSK